MLYVISCVDKADHLHIRMENRPAHVDHLKSNLDRLVLAGPTLTEDGETPTGSVIIMEFDNQAEAEAFAAADPYAKAGLFETVTIKPWRQALPQ
jgi:uncharacterized protein YciI